MKKKNIVCGVLASSVAVAATFGGCSLVSTNPGADMNQVIAEVDISKAAALSSEFSEDYTAAVGSTSIIKRELVAYFINYGYSYVQNYGYSYEETFNYLLDSLIENAVLVQYSTMYLLEKKVADEGESVLDTFKDKKSEGEIAKYEYLLGEDSKEVKIAEYNLRYSVNSAIDAREKEILKKKTTTAGTETRTTPSGVDTQKEDYYPQVSKEDDRLNYGIYTGYEGYLLEDSGAYEKDKLEGTNIASRIKAYNKFISSLASSSYDLVDTKTENLREVRNLKYIQDEYVSQLEQCVINKYYDVYEEEQEALLKQLGEDEEFKLINSAYKSLLNSQKESYKKESSFTSAMDGMSDTSFVLYAPETDDTDKGGRFGYVYNILLPFSTSQSDALKIIQSIYADSDLDGGYEPDYFVARNKLLKNIVTTDQRAAWFNGETEYAFNAKEKVEDYYGKEDGKDAWLFFENNVSNPDKYEAIDKYAGLYPYNGTVIEKDDDYLLVPNELKIDDMLEEFENYISFVTEGNCTATTVPVAGYGENLKDALYLKDGEEFVMVEGKKKIDYSNFVYATGSVDFGNNNGIANTRANFLNRDSYQYKVLSAVNELQYAYTTDTGVLSQYVGYSVQAGDTSYIKEFEYAAHEAVKKGAGTYYVCAGDYGWHLIYVTYTFEAGDIQYGEEPDWQNNIETEGTFENLFYEWYKDNTLSNIGTKRKGQIITDFKVDATVTKYESRYQNLLDLDKDN